MNIDEKDICCNLLEINYINKLKEKLKLNNMDNYELRKILFPYEWKYITDKDKKVLILKEAIETEIKILETKLFNEYFNDYSNKKI